jgi:DNA polymerase bacteriophage-type
MMTHLYLDLETFSETPITYGTHVYAADAEILLVAWAWDDGPVQVLDLTLPNTRPDGIAQAILDPKVKVVIHHSHFDRTVIHHAWGVDTPTARIHDTMIQALSHGLPASLGMLCEVLGLPTDKAKDKDGKRLIQLFCKPLGKNRILRRATRETHPAEWERFKAYAASDIEAMREVMKRMPMINMTPAETALWQLDQTINDRGVAIDMDLVDAAINAVGKAQRELSDRSVELTDGQVTNTTQGAALRLHILESYGIDMPDLQMATVEKTLAMDIDPSLKELLRVRLQASSTSTAKYKVLRKGTSADGRLRGLLQFNGAARTGRWAGRLFQPQNLPRPTLKQEQIDLGIEALKAECAHLITDNTMELISSSIRSCIVAPDGQKLIVADLANIEGRVQAWLANEEWKLKAFRDFDEGTGPDLYKMAYSKSFGVAPDKVNKDQRQVGKVQELALAYEGGVGAFSTFAGAYNINLEDLAVKVLELADEELVARADYYLERVIKEKKSRYGLSDDAFVACDVLKRAWRVAHPNISGYWGRLKNAVTQALHTRGQTYTTLGLKIKAAKSWLLITLPSGRSLCYPSPKVMADGSITYMGIDQFTRKWTRVHTHGGKLFENLCQAIARDVMAANMPLIEAAGYKIVLSIHDELVTEAPDEPQYNAEHLSKLLAANPSWASDMPLAAAGFESYRYRKD